MAEDLVAQRVLDLATRAARDSAADEGSSYVGTYLIGERRADLSRMIGCREALRFRTLRWIYRYHSLVYFTGIGFFSVALVSLLLLIGLRGEAPDIQFLLALLMLIPVSQLSLEVMNYLVMRLLPPRPLPKMDYRVSGIPDECRTLVVVPIVLADLETVQDEAEKLEIRYLANKENNLLFGLFSDYADATADPL